MKHVTLEELENIVQEAKAGIIEAAEESDTEIVVTVESCDHAFDSHAITITDDDIYVPVGCDLGTSADISVVGADADGEALAPVLAVFSDVLDIELDEEHFILPGGMDGLLEQAEWYAANGLG